MKTPKLTNHTQLKEYFKNNRFPLLYTITKQGKIRVWACWVNDDTIYRTSGFIDGKISEPQIHTYLGNTIRSSSEQAQLEAEKLWLKQFDHDYRPADDDVLGKTIEKHVKLQKEQNGGMNRGVRLFDETAITEKTTAGKKDLQTSHRPMLAKKYKDWKKDEFTLTSPGQSIEFPAIAQSKVDGIRSIVYIDTDDSVILESRNGKNFVFLDHIRNEIKRWLTFKKCKSLILDGEFYIHNLYKDKQGNPTKKTTNDSEIANVGRFQFISEACKITRKQAHKFEDLVEFWLFDIWNPDKTNAQRWKQLSDLFKDYTGDILHLVPTKIVNSHDEIENFMKTMIGEETSREGYEFEGVMIRQSKAKYETKANYHSSNLLKYKRFDDEEWEVYGAEKCIGGIQNGAIKWLCKKDINGISAKLIAKQMGDTTASKKTYIDYSKHPNKYIGKMINIRFNERSKDGIPRFPRATVFPEDK